MPKRVLAVFGFSAFISALLAASAGPEVSRTLAVTAGVLAFFGIGALVAGRKALAKSEKSGNLPVRVMVGSVMALAACALVLGRYCWAWQEQVESVAFLDNGEATAVVRILDFPEERYHQYYYQAQVKELNGIQTEDIPIRLSCREPLYCQPYDQLKLQVVFYQFQEGSDWFSTRSTQLAAGNVLGAYPTGEAEQRVQDRVYSPARLAALVRRQVSRGLNRYLPKEEAGLIRAVLLGDKSDISRGVSNGFARIGASHLMAVSGLHIAVLAAFVFWLVQRIPLGRWGRFLICCTGLLSYLCLIGFPASALRSALMFFLALLAKSLGHRGDTLNALGLALLVICVFRPFSGRDLGFVLSVTATVGIILLYRPVMEACTHLLSGLPGVNQLLRPLWAAVSVTVSANAFSLPVQLEAFGGISLLLIPANLLLVPLVSGLLYCALPLAALAPFSGAEPLARLFGFCAGWMARLVLWVEGTLASLPGSFWFFDSLWLAVLGWMALWCLVVLKKPLRRKRTAALLGVLLIVLNAGWISTDAQRDALSISVAGDGESVCVLVTENGRAAAVSLGGYRSSMAEQMLRREHITAVESVLLPERSPQAREMLADLADACPVGRLILPEGAYVWKAMEKMGVPVEFAPLGQSWELLPGVEIQLEQEGEGLSILAGGREISLKLEKQSGLYLSLPGEAASAREMGILFRAEETPTWELFQGESPGSYIVLREMESLVLRIGPDGHVRYELYD